MRFRRLFLVCSVAALFAGCDSGSGATGTKSLEALNEAELGGVNFLLRDIFQRATRGNTCFEYATTYRSLPLEKGGARDLPRPITLLSYTCFSRLLQPQTLQFIRDDLANRSGTWEESGQKRSVTITRYHFLPSPGRDRDGLAIIPDELKIE